MIFFIECIVACALFTIALEIMCARRREIFTNDYSPVVTDKLHSLNLVAEKPLAKKSDIIRKVIVWFHFKGSVKGTIIGLVFAPVVGLIVMLMQGF